MSLFSTLMGSYLVTAGTVNQCPQFGVHVHLRDPSVWPFIKLTFFFFLHFNVDGKELPLQLSVTLCLCLSVSLSLSPFISKSFFISIYQVNSAPRKKIFTADSVCFHSVDYLLNSASLWKTHLKKIFLPKLASSYTTRMLS